MKNHNILLIDGNDPKNREIGQELSRKGYNFYVTQLADEALRMIREDSVDFIMLDLSIQTMNPLDMLRQLLLEKHNAIVIVLTGQNTNELSTEALRSGALDFITKPLSSNDLELVLERTRKFSEITGLLRTAEMEIMALDSKLKNLDENNNN
jgi:DNA-binding NtrC family response regulator